MTSLPTIDYQSLDREQSAQLDELTKLYSEVYAEPPYEWGPEHTQLFRERLEVQRKQEGYRLVTAREDGDLVAFGFGVTL